MNAKTKAERRAAARSAKTPTPRVKPIEEAYRPRAKQIELVPRNANQADYIDLLYTEGKDILFATGPAGTGKTFLPSLYAVREMKDAGYRKIVLTRPLIENGEKIGALPGDINEKVGPWLNPIFDAFGKAGIGPAEIAAMLDKGVLEIAPLEMMRGRSFENTFILADEMQNSTKSQMKMLLTRIGEGSRMVITGDLEQRDRTDEECGLLDFLDRLGNAPRSRTNRFGLVEFDESDVVRHPIIRDVLRLYA
ncbi:phosphate starvation-inducible [Citromicrobium phage vB_CbaS-RXM]|nr:phosphate starvation-inducible [Citromicrobium phage vB_CbaS-RXM]